MPTFSPEALTQFATDLLAAAGVGDEEAAAVAESLVAANLRGYDSHGVMRLPFYVRRARKGEVVPGAEFEVRGETASTLTVDAHWGFGQTQTRRLAERLVAKARQSGVGVGTMKRCAHIGRLGQYCEAAAEAGLVSMLMVNNHGAVQRVAPPGGKVPRLPTNPIAVGIPHGEEPIVIDFCTSVTAEGKVRVKQIAGEPCPDGWLLDSEGRPTNDPDSLYADPPGSILPMGGSQPYKGFALGLMVELLTGALSGGVCARPVPINPIGNCVFMMVLDPAHFGGAEHFARETADLVAFIRACPRVEGVDEIVLPGDPERCTLRRKLAEGIALDEKNWRELVRLAEALEVETPG